MPERGAFTDSVTHDLKAGDDGEAMGKGRLFYFTLIAPHHNSLPVPSASMNRTAPINRAPMSDDTLLQQQAIKMRRLRSASAERAWLQTIGRQSPHRWCHRGRYHLKRYTGSDRCRRPGCRLRSDGRSGYRGEWTSWWASETMAREGPAMFVSNSRYTSMLFAYQA